MSEANGVVSLGLCSIARKNLISGLSEFFAMAFFVYVGCGSVASKGSLKGDVAFTFGLAIVVAVYFSAHRSGGHVNPAVTLALVLSGDCNPISGLIIMAFQAAGACFGALMLSWTFKEKLSKNLGANILQDDYNWWSVFFGETFMGFMLMAVIYETAIHDKSIARSERKTRPVTAPIAIGLVVYCAHIVLIPIDGCALNPARTLGPAVVSWWRGDEGNKIWENFFPMVAFPTAGCALAALFKRFGQAHSYFTSAKKTDQGMRRASAIDLGRELESPSPDITVVDNAGDQKGDFSE